MVQQQELDRIFASLADGTRRGILVRLGEGPATIGELAEPTGMTLTGMKKHVRVLEEAGLVLTEKVGRARQCRLAPAPLDDAMAWISFYQRLWARRLDGLDAFFTLQRGAPGPSDRAASTPDSAKESSQLPTPAGEADPEPGPAMTSSPDFGAGEEQR